MSGRRKARAAREHRELLPGVGLLRLGEHELSVDPVDELALLVDVGGDGLPLQESKPHQLQITTVRRPLALEEVAARALLDHVEPLLGDVRAEGHGDGGDVLADREHILLGCRLGTSDAPEDVELVAHGKRRGVDRVGARLGVPSQWIRPEAARPRHAELSIDRGVEGRAPLHRDGFGLPEPSPRHAKLEALGGCVLDEKVQPLVAKREPPPPVPQLASVDVCVPVALGERDGGFRVFVDRVHGAPGRREDGGEQNQPSATHLVSSVAVLFAMPRMASSMIPVVALAWLSLRASPR